MLTRVNTVNIGKKDPVALTGATILGGTSRAAAYGEILLFDENKQLLTIPTDSNETIYVGVVRNDVQATMNPAGTSEKIARIDWSTPINKNLVKSIRHASYEAPALQVTAVDFSSSTIIVGKEYVLRLIYKDIYFHPGQFTQTYRVIARTTVPADLATAFAKAVNGHRVDGRYGQARVVATVVGNVLTLTAKEVDDNQGVDSINNFTYVNFRTRVFFYDAGNPAPQEIPGIIVTPLVLPSPGNGYWKIVRDREKYAMAYKGVTNNTWFPVIKPEMMVEPEQEYNTIVIEHGILYRSPDNQYKKGTPVTTEVYLPVGGSQTFNFLTAINAWLQAFDLTSTAVDINSGAEVTVSQIIF